MISFGLSRNLNTLLIFLWIGNSIQAQTILIQPYLQNSSPSSMVIMWETNTNPESIIQYGLSPALGNSISGTSITTLGSTVLHTVSLTTLNPGTKYYYKAITGNWQSSIYDFVTPPLRTSEAGCNIVLMSDMQKDGGNPTVFNDLINTSLLPFISDHYGTPLSEHLQLVVLPGDVVDNGNAYLQWKNDFFNPGEALWRHVPSYPAIGNHEVNSPNYFTYFNLPANGTSGYLEHWYSTDYSNVRVLSFDTNPSYRIQAQLNWLDSMLTASCADPLIDFVFAEMHHPYKSELWIPGEADYTGEIVERLENFTSSCGKPTIHFFGHTHAYSRGESRDHKHLWVNVATSGGNIDYWGEFQNADYEEYVISQDEYGFVMVEVTAGANPQFIMRRLSFGDEFNPGGNTETDMLTIKMNNAAPQKPFALFPTSIDTVSTYCLSLKADGFFDPDNDGHGASHWQISTDSANFSNPIFDSWKQYANWYDEVNLQADDDLTDEEFSNLPADATLWWRVRYRDKSLEWSPWSTHTKFQTRSLELLTGNLVTNPGAESGTNNWTSTIGVIESLNTGECNGISPYQGLKYFAVGALCAEHPFASAYQNIIVTNYESNIDAGEVLVHYGGHLADWQNTDQPSFALQFLNAGGQVISGTDTIKHQQSAWTLKQNTIAVPIGTRTIRFIVMGTRFAGVDNDSYFDNLFLELFSGDFSCSYYQSPGELNGRIYVDKTAIAFPDGESWFTAYHSLGVALNLSNSDTSKHEIWIAEGSYPVTTGHQRDSSFHITRSVEIYGGFAGMETSIAQRDIQAHPTILTGEIADTSFLGDNSYHVIKIEGLVDTVRLDGLNICCGYADEISNNSGGGIYISNSNTSVILLDSTTLYNNFAVEGSSLFNASNTRINFSTIISSVIEGSTGCSIFNSGNQAKLSLKNSVIRQTCTTCPEIFRNHNGAILFVDESVSIERE